jgi:lipopolysaccharide export LptBFGC system permease protein LptF
MSRPGDRLRALASRVCSSHAMERVIDPAIADLQREHADAIAQGEAWRARRIRVAGTIAVWKVFGVHAVWRAIPVAREWAAADEGAMGRTVAFSLASIAIVMVSLALLPFYAVLQIADDGRAYLPVTADEVGWLALYVLPQALPLAVPIGFATGIGCALRGRRATVRVRRSIVVIAIGCSLLMLAVMTWVVPVANQAFRELVMHRTLPRGSNELTLAELRSSGRQYEYHGRIACSLGTVIVGLFAFTASAITRGRARSIAIGTVGAVVYWCGYVLLTAPALNGSIPPLIAAWTPNAVFALVTAAMMSRARSSR